MRHMCDFLNTDGRWRVNSLSRFQWQSLTIKNISSQKGDDLSRVMLGLDQSITRKRSSGHAENNET